jgi:CRP-like cAMP-binding protein
VEFQEQLYKLVQATYPVSDEAFNALAASWQPVSVKRKQLLTRTGEVEKWLYFVLDGVQRAFYEHNGKEATLVFSYAPSFSGVLDSFFTQTPSRFHLETLTASKLMKIHYNDLNQLMETQPEIERWVRVSLSHVLAGTLERQVELLSFSAEEKFRALLKRSPHVLNLIPQKYLASYIGIDETTFSKMISSIRL